MSKNVVIIGQGEIGRAIKHLLKKTKHRVSIECWDIDIKACPMRKPLGNIIPKADVLFLCIPSWTIQSAVRDLNGYLKRDTVVVSVSKGLDRSTGLTVDAVMHRAFVNRQHTVLLSGPMLAEEIVLNKPAAAVAASKSPKARESIAELFKDTRLHISTTTDVRGVAICGILKNIYAIGFGLAQAYHPGDNYRGLYVQMTLDEMARIVTKLGGMKETVYSHAGIGDLIATGFSKHSKNHEYGMKLARNGRVSFDSEGSVSIQPMLKKVGAYKKELRLFALICSIIQKQLKPRTILEI